MFGTMQRVRTAMMALCAAAVLTILGCGEGGPKQYTVSGTVTFDNEPVSEGRITFRKTSGDGKAFSADIKDGKYEIKTESGEMAVEVIASRIIPGKFDTSNPGEKNPIGEMYIPKRYNSETILKSKVESNMSDENFTLTSK